MKLQYMGDSKDSFKWDYHDYLLKELGYPVLNIMLMMTPDDQSNDGKSRPSLFPARREIIEFCNDLRNERDIKLIYELPDRTGSNYIINLHKPETHLTNLNRKIYFSGLSEKQNQLLFLDPDNGFEPGNSFSKKHVLYSDIKAILEQISDDSVISIFQHFRYVKFAKDFAQMKECLLPCNATAIYWNFLMFVCLSKSKRAIEKVINANIRYAKSNPVKIIA